MKPSEKLVERVIKSADSHGNQTEEVGEGRGGQIGDLEDALRVCWRVLKKAQREAIYAELKDNVESWL